MGRLWPLRQQLTHLEQGGGPYHQGEGEGGIARRERQAQQLDEGQVDDACHQHGYPQQHGHQQQRRILAHGEVAGERQAGRRRQDGDGGLGGIRHLVAEDEAIEHQRQHQGVAGHAEPEQAIGQGGEGATGIGDVGHYDPHRRHEPARHHVVNFKRLGPVPDEGGEEHQVNDHRKQPEPLAQGRGQQPHRLGDHHGPHGIGGHHAAHHGVGEILPQQTRVQQELEGEDEEQHGGDGGPQQLQAAIELTGIFPTPAEAGDPESQPGHGGRGGGKGATGACDHDWYPLVDDDVHRIKRVYRLRYLNELN